MLRYFVVESGNGWAVIDRFDNAAVHSLSSHSAAKEIAYWMNRTA